MTTSVQPKVNRSGFSYFFQGFSLIRTPGIRRFVFVPLLVNMVLFGFAFYQLSFIIADLTQQISAYLPEVLSWLVYVVKPLLYLTAIVCFSFLFATLANWIAAPFNGLLAEKIELHLSNQPLSTGGLFDAVKDVPRTLKREWRKLIYYIPRALGFLLILFLLPVIGQVIWFIFVAWMMAIQYCDFSFDNHKVSFDEMRAKLRSNKGVCLSFGIMVTFFSMIPLLNLILMPVAICGATAIWVDRFKNDYQ
ncbi:sulfate transporter CysZ [Thalassotalea aquiviva]|uniref:sulfate transporter CysZ n=1 Tax=Thalassotalea aquiviva TaxID=3242415 RepID=UPI00352B063D